MDIEEFKKALKTAEAKVIIDEIVEKAKAGLIAKNEELLALTKEQKETQKELNKRLEAIEKAKEEAETEAATKSGDIEKIKQQLTEKHAKELTKLQGEKDALAGQLNVHVVDGSLTQALVKAGIAPQFMEAATALIKTANKAEIDAVDGKPVAKLSGKAVDDFVTEWSKSEAGKHFVSAGFSSGGGSNGADGSGKAATGTTMRRTDFEALTPLAKMEASKKGVVLTE